MRAEPTLLPAVHALLAGFFPSPGFLVECRQHAAGSPVPALLPEEHASLGPCVPPRRDEFARGRACVRAALQRFGVPAVAVLRGLHGRPQWPAGVCGSLSHAGDGLVACVLARRGDVAAVGLDIECCRDAPGPAQWRYFCTADEMRWLEGLPEPVRPVHAQALFSAKEAIYKCLFEATGRRLVYGDACVRADLAGRRFRARLAGPGVPALVQGRVGVAGDVVVAGLWLAAAAQQ